MEIDLELPGGGFSSAYKVTCHECIMVSIHGWVVEHSMVFLLSRFEAIMKGNCHQPTNNWAMKKNPWLFRILYIGDYTTQLHREYDKQL